MSETIAVFGYGACGEAVTQLAATGGREVIVAQRRAPAHLPAAARFRAADILDTQAVMAAADGASQIVLAVGFAYDGRVWKDAWPKAIANILAAAEKTGARVVFVDNLYMYGPQDRPLTEDMPLTDYGAKPATRAAVTRQWMAAATAGRVKFAALRAPDFYGPAVGALSMFGDMGLGALAKGKAATLIVPPDQLHDFAYVPDIGRAVVTLLDAPDDAFGQAWHVPSAPTTTARNILRLGAAELGAKPRITAIPLWALPALGLAMPMLKGFVEMRFVWDRPYRVDHQKFAKRFWGDATPFEVGAVATARSFALPARQAA
ncbi:MAG: NAD-dependent epimerase/dehydratase family protein [Ancalomicrobiaceae bacterium]|nr:NAD-dependent epimerase/dehydratase family protein [Ancalomicrobiaceae bacterium]